MSHFNRIGDRQVRKEATKRRQVPLESLDIELKTPVSGVVRDHSGESFSIRP